MNHKLLGFELKNEITECLCRIQAIVDSDVGTTDKVAKFNKGHETYIYIYKLHSLKTFNSLNKQFFIIITSGTLNPLRIEAHGSNQTHITLETFANAGVDDYQDHWQ